jgi:hypothetical protein
MDLDRGIDVPPRPHRAPRAAYHLPRNTLHAAFAADAVEATRTVVVTRRLL